jgi:hypothetical protein
MKAARSGGMPYTGQKMFGSKPQIFGQVVGERTGGKNSRTRKIPLGRAQVGMTKMGQTRGGGSPANPTGGTPGLSGTKGAGSELPLNKHMRGETMHGQVGRGPLKPRRGGTIGY